MYIFEVLTISNVRYFFRKYTKAKMVFPRLTQSLSDKYMDISYCSSCNQLPRFYRVGIKHDFPKKYNALLGNHEDNHCNLPDFYSHCTDINPVKRTSNIQ